MRYLAVVGVENFIIHRPDLAATNQTVVNRRLCKRPNAAVAHPTKGKSEAPSARSPIWYIEPRNM
jgi:hypothetical protein